MSKNGKIDEESKRLIERTRLSLLIIVSKLCLISTTNDNDTNELRDALIIAKGKLSEIELYLMDDF